jgi:cholesterol transport system auxiliary component
MRSYARPFLSSLCAVFVFAAVSSCVEFPGVNDAPPRLYVLTPKSTFPKDMPAVKWQLLVETPNSPAGLNTARIALQDSPVELRYFRKANWTDFGPKMVQSLMIESFENSGRIVSVGREQIGLRSDFVLKSDLREFQAEYDGAIPVDATALAATHSAPWARVRVNLKLVKMPQREIVATETFERRVRATANTMTDIIAAFDEALGKTLKSAVVWTLKTGEKYKSRRRRR